MGEKVKQGGFWGVVVSSVDANPRRTIPADLQFAEWHARDGWALRRFTRAPRSQPHGSLLFLGGRADFVEKHLEAIDCWHRSGWRVDGFDWRGQGGSGRLVPNGNVCHLDSFDPLVDDLEDFIAEWRASTDGPHVAVAHSMGAHVLLRLLAERRGQLDGAVLVSPMFALPRGPLPAAALPLIAGTAIALGLARRPLWRRDPGNIGDRLTACPERHADKLWWKANKPQIATGPPSWGWVHSAIRSIRSLDDEGELAAIDTPLLIMGSRGDMVVDAEGFSRVAERLASAELVLLPGKGHELLREADAARMAVMERIERFLVGIAEQAAANPRVARQANG
jgi:lysophospholipase